MHTSIVRNVHDPTRGMRVCSVCSVGSLLQCVMVVDGCDLVVECEDCDSAGEWQEPTSAAARRANAGVAREEDAMVRARRCTARCGLRW
jgi:phage/plasmid primase-like uncharacterized protein